MPTTGSPGSFTQPLATARSGAARLRLGRKDIGLLVGLAIVLGWVVCAIFAPIIAPHSPNYQQIDGLNRLGAPYAPGESHYLLGTDELGRDELSRLIYGSRVAVFIAIVPNAIGLAIATLVGVTAGYFRGHVEGVLMRFTETVMVLPALLLALALLQVVGPGTEAVVVALVLITWTYPARVVYGEVLRIRENTYVEAVRALGAGPIRIVARHILPALGGLLITYFTLNAAFMVLLEAGLSFLGFGVQPPTASWGAMIGAVDTCSIRPWLTCSPGRA